MLTLLDAMRVLYNTVIVFQLFASASPVMNTISAVDITPVWRYVLLPGDSVREDVMLSQNHPAGETLHFTKVGWRWGLCG